MRNVHLRSVLFVLVFTIVAVACGGEDSEVSGDAGRFAPGVLDSGATIGTFEQGDLIVHTYANPESGFGNTTAIIESENALVLIDAHFGDPWASEFRAFVDSLGKPIDRLLITHDHPDHIGGINVAFGDVDTYSSAGVVEAAATEGVAIGNDLAAGEVVIDGVTFRIDVFTEAEAGEQVVIVIPEAGVIAAGDLVYSDYHAVMTPTFDNWISILEGLRSENEISFVVPGHGTPGGVEIIDAMEQYLDAARSVYADSDDADSFNAAMVEAFPDRSGANLLDFGAGRLFPKS